MISIRFIYNSAYGATPFIIANVFAHENKTRNQTAAHNNISHANNKSRGSLQVRHVIKHFKAYALTSHLRRHTRRRTVNVANAHEYAGTCMQFYI